jgi:hypothetical protein
MADYINRLLLIAPFLIHFQGVMRKLLDDPGFTFWLFCEAHNDVRALRLLGERRAPVPALGLKRP